MSYRPKLLDQLQSSKEPVTRQLSEEAGTSPTISELSNFLCYHNILVLLSNPAKSMEMEKISLTEAQFRRDHNEDQMAVEKLSEGIRKFAADTIKLEQLIRSRLQ